MKQKNAVAIHDISCFGKCSLTIAMPILSAAGVATSVIPTAVLSTHTGGLPGNTFRDLSDDIIPIAKHWKGLGLEFDAIYTGYLGSYDQLVMLTQFFELFRNDNNVILVDPVMGDNGRLYTSFNERYVDGMARFCRHADIIVPNMTEATMMLGKPYTEGPYTKEYIEELLLGLSKLGPDGIVLTGVYFNDEKIGAATFDKKRNKIEYSMANKVEGCYHGTGDVFSAALLGAVLKDKPLGEAAQIAADYTAKCIDKTRLAGTDERYGVNFEQQLPEYIKAIG